MSKSKNSKESLKPPINSKNSKTSSKKQKSKASIKTTKTTKSGSRIGSLKSLLGTNKKATKIKTDEEKNLKTKFSNNETKVNPSDPTDIKNSEREKPKTNDKDETNKKVVEEKHKDIKSNISQSISNKKISENKSTNNILQNKSTNIISQSSIQNKSTANTSQKNSFIMTSQSSVPSKLATIPENSSEKSHSKTKVSDKIDLENIFPVLGNCDISPLGEIIDRIDKRNIGRSNTCDRFPYDRKRSLADIANEVDTNNNSNTKPTAQSKNTVKTLDERSLLTENISNLKSDLTTIESKDDLSNSASELYPADSIFSVNSIKSSTSNQVVSLFDVFNIETDEKIDELFERMEREECNKLAALQAQALRNQPKETKDASPRSIQEDWNDKRIQEKEALEKQERNKIEHDKNGIRSNFFGSAMPTDCSINKFYDRLQSKIVGSSTDNLFHLSDKLMDELKSVNKVNHFKNSQQARARLDQFCDEFHQLKAEGRLQITNSATNQMFENLPFNPDHKSTNFQPPTSRENNVNEKTLRGNNKNSVCRSSDPNENFMKCLEEQIKILSQKPKRKVEKEKCSSDESIDIKKIMNYDIKNSNNKQDTFKQKFKRRNNSNCSFVSDTSSVKSRKSVCFQLCRDNSDPRIVFPGKCKQSKRSSSKFKRSTIASDSDSNGSFEYEIVRI